MTTLSKLDITGGDKDALDVADDDGELKQLVFRR